MWVTANEVLLVYTTGESTVSVPIIPISMPETLRTGSLSGTVRKTLTHQYVRETI